MKKALLCLLVGIFLGSCKGTTGPAGPLLTGTLTGFVKLINVDGTPQTDQSGVTISVTGTKDTATSDVNGKFELKNVETGTYEIDYSKSTYGSYKMQAVTFASGGDGALPPVTLGAIPVSSPIPVIKATSSSGVSVTVSGSITTAATSVQFYMVYMGKSSNINPLDPTTYINSQAAQINAQSSAFQTSAIWSLSNLRSLGIINSTTPNLWFVCYPYNPNGSSYTDIYTNITVYPAVTSQGSSAVSASTP